jgi:hypothetical protein
VGQPQGYDLPGPSSRETPESCAGLKSFLSAIATGVLLFLLWDVLTLAVDLIETAINPAIGRGSRSSPYTLLFASVWGY